MCRTVTYGNAQGEHPAIITRVQNDSTLNLHVFFDAAASEPRVNVKHKDAGELAYWRWPDRV